MIGEPLIGQYVAGESYVHRLDPRTKLGLLLGYTIVLFALHHWPAYAVMTLSTLLAAAAARVTPASVLGNLRPLAWLFALTVVLNSLAVSGRPLLHLGPLTISQEGLLLGLRLGVRLALLVVTASLLTLTTSPIALTDGLESLLRPLGRWLPVHEIAMMMTVALRFIPTLAEEAERIMKAQMARGADFQRGGPVRRLRSLLPLLVPLFVSAFRRADELALAMEARGYRGGAGRTRYRELRLRPLDALAGSLGVLVLVGALLMDRAAGS